MVISQHQLSHVVIKSLVRSHYTKYGIICELEMRHGNRAIKRRSLLDRLIDISRGYENVYRKMKINMAKANCMANHVRKLRRLQRFDVLERLERMNKVNLCTKDQCYCEDACGE